MMSMSNSAYVFAREIGSVVVRVWDDACWVGGVMFYLLFFFSSRRRHTRCSRDWSSDVCSSDLGKEYLVSCKRALRLLREGRELLDKHRTSPSGLLRIACPITMARDLIAPLLSKFMEAFPDLRVELETYSSRFDQEPKEDIDVFFKVRAPNDSSRRVRSYPGVARGLFASRRYVLTAGKPAGPAELTAHRCIGSGRWTLSNGGKTVTPDLAPRVVTDDPLVHRDRKSTRLNSSHGYISYAVFC